MPKDKAKAAPRILLVDDDPIFTKLMGKIAQKEKMHLVSFLSVREAYRDLMHENYDVVILVYDLGKVTGIQLSHYIENRGHLAPVVLVSASGAIDKQRWSKSVKDSLPKSLGPYAIFVSAIRAYDEAQANKM